MNSAARPDLSVVTGVWDGRSVVRNLTSPDWLWGSASQQLNVYRGSFPGAKRPGCEVEHSPPSRTEVKNEWSYTSALPIRLHGGDRKIFISF